MDKATSKKTTPRRVRLRGLIVALVCFGAIFAAWRLTPSNNGHGTHTQMGLSGCGFLARTGYPCPGCGVTTSLAAMAHGRVDLAVRAHLFGVFLFLAVATFAVLGMADALTGGDTLSKTRPGLWWTWLALGALALGWGVKVGLGVLTGDYPLWP